MQQPGRTVRRAADSSWLGTGAWITRRVSLWLLGPVVAAFCPAAAAADAPVAIYVSATSRAYYPSVGGSYDAMIDPWRALLLSGKIAFREVDSPAGLAQHQPGVLLLPSAVALNPAEREALLRFRDAGGSILATWALGTRDGQGKWLGHDFIKELMGFVVAGEIGTDTSNHFLIPYGNSPVNHTIAAGRRIWIGKLAEKPLHLKGGVEAGVYLDWSRTVFKAGDVQAAIVFDEGGRAHPAGRRRVMFGFAETAWSFQPDDVQALAADAIRWLQHIPGVQLAAWPNGHRSAQIIEMDTEEGFANAIHFGELLEGINAAGTFYCLTSEARKHGDLLRRLALHHEIGFHGEVHVGFKNATREIQRRRLDRMLAEMRSVVGTTAGWPTGVGRGFRAPTESYDGTTDVLLQSLGVRHHVADPNSSQDRLPLFSPVATPNIATGLVLLPRSQLDDLNYIHLKLSPAQIGQALIGEYDLNLRMGGLSVLSVHSQNFADPAQLLIKPLHSSLMTRAVEALTQYIGPRHNKAWIAPAGKVADWWRERSRATVTSSVTGKQVDVSLTVNGPEPVRGLTVLIDHPAEAVAPILQAEAGKVQPTVRRVDRFTSGLVFSAALAPGRHSYRLTFP